MTELKDALKAEGVPEDEEAAMIRATGLREESPSKKAQQTVRPPMKSEEAA